MATRSVALPLFILIALASQPLRAESSSTAGSVATVGSRVDPSVARAVAEAAARLPVPESGRDDESRDPTFAHALAKGKRRCTIEAVAAIGAILACGSSNRCSTTPPLPPALVPARPPDGGCPFYRSKL